MSYRHDDGSWNWALIGGHLLIIAIGVWGLWMAYTDPRVIR